MTQKDHSQSTDRQLLVYLVERVDHIADSKADKEDLQAVKDEIGEVFTRLEPLEKVRIGVGAVGIFVSATASALVVIAGLVLAYMALN